VIVMATLTLLGHSVGERRRHRLRTSPSCGPTTGIKKEFALGGGGCARVNVAAMARYFFDAIKGKGGGPRVKVPKGKSTKKNCGLTGNWLGYRLVAGPADPGWYSPAQ